MYVIYSIWRDMLSECRRGREKRREGFFHSSGSLDGSEIRDGRTWWWKLMVFCSQEFVVALCKYPFVRFFLSILIMRHAVTRIINFWHLCLPQFYGVAKTATFQQIVFHRSWNFREQSNLNSLTRTQVHGYILQVVNFYRFYYFFLLIVNSFDLFILC